MDKSKLYKAAADAAKESYSPYSGFCVGAALLCDDGTIFTGCNVENAAYSVTVCAERVALFSAIAAGHRKFKAIAICGGRDGNFTAPCPPCGVCRQALAEFCAGDMPVILSDGEHNIDKLLPMSFGTANME